MKEPAKVLTIAGSDSGGAAGLQADLKTFTLLGVYGLSVITAVTAQNSLRVAAIHTLPPDFVAAQLDAVFSDYGTVGQGIAAVKTGFIGRVDLIEIIALKLRQYKPRYIVVDPILVNHRGESMFPPDVTQSYVEHLLPLAHLVTPNRREAELLLAESAHFMVAGRDLETAAQRLGALGPRNVLIKGIDDGPALADVLWDGQHRQRLPHPRIETSNTHGSGDTLSAAVSAFLAQGQTMAAAVQKGQQFTAQAIQKAAAWQLGRGHGPVAHLK